MACQRALARKTCCVPRGWKRSSIKGRNSPADPDYPALLTTISRPSAPKQMGILRSSEAALQAAEEVKEPGVENFELYKMVAELRKEAATK